MSSTDFLGFNDHHALVGAHAFLSASKYHWLNYDDEKVISTYNNSKDAERGTELHELAAKLIKLGIKLPHSNKTLNLYVNDAIGFKMKPEQVLFYSDLCFGTTDAICFRDEWHENEDGVKEKKKWLRIHDYKSGETIANMKQLYIYAALFCLEYKINPFDIEMELRIYQLDQVFYDRPDPKTIREVADLIVHDVNLIQKYRDSGIIDIG